MRKGIIISIVGLFTALMLYPIGYFVLPPAQDITNISQGEHTGVAAYIINMDHSKERYAYIYPQVKDLGYAVHRVRAVNGKLLSPKEVDSVLDSATYTRFLGHVPKLGTIGCSLSHIKAWKAFLESHYQFAIIFEDDVSFKPTQLHAAVEWLVHNAQAWDIVNFETSHWGAPLTLRQIDEQSRLVVYLTEVTHSGAYLINRKAAEKLVSRALPITMPIDHYVTRSWEFELKFAGLEPRLAHQTYGTSEINATQKPQEMQDNVTLRDRAHKAIYKVQSYMIRIWYNFSIYLKGRE